MSFAIFDETFYLSNNPDVRAAVNARTFSSGLQHFQLSGLAEGRVQVSPFYNEEFYLRKYPDIAAAVRSGAFSSGLQHYIQYGEAEGRDGTPFSEQLYSVAYPDVATAVDAGAVSSGLQHYLQYGQQENRTAFLLGTSGNDTITGFGNGSNFITGVSVDALLAPNVGIGEVDILMGAQGTDIFSLGFPNTPPLIPTTLQFYVGGGNTDYATIEGFQRYSDFILLTGSSQNYTLQAINGNLNISAASGDLLGIVEGITSLVPLPLSSQVLGLSSGVSGQFFILG